MSHSNTAFAFSIAFLTLLITSQSVVPSSKTFRYVNKGPLGEYSVEYEADYRLAIHCKFSLCPCLLQLHTKILGLRMGHRRSESIIRWVWDANRGKLVHENATLTFGSDGNLVFADVDGKVAWQTGTANKGVVGLDLLLNGNLVLYDSKGKFIGKALIIQMIHYWWVKQEDPQAQLGLPADCPE